MEKAGPFDCCCSHQSVASPSLWQLQQTMHQTRRILALHLSDKNRDSRRISGLSLLELTCLDRWTVHTGLRHMRPIASTVHVLYTNVTLPRISGDLVYHRCCYCINTQNATHFAYNGLPLGANALFFYILEINSATVVARHTRDHWFFLWWLVSRLSKMMLHKILKNAPYFCL